MTGKEYLSQIKKLGEQISILDDEIRSLKEEETLIRSAWPDGQPHGSGTTDPVGRMATRLADRLVKICEEYEHLRAKLDRQRIEIIKVIGQVSRAEYNKLLYLRYVQDYKWEDIAEEMHYSERHLSRMHDIATEEVEKILRDKHVL